MQFLPLYKSTHVAINNTHIKVNSQQWRKFWNRIIFVAAVWLNEYSCYWDNLFLFKNSLAYFSKIIWTNSNLYSFNWSCGRSVAKMLQSHSPLSSTQKHMVKNTTPITIQLLDSLIFLEIKLNLQQTKFSINWATKIKMKI